MSGATLIRSSCFQSLEINHKSAIVKRKYFLSAAICSQRTSQSRIHHRLVSKHRAASALPPPFHKKPPFSSANSLRRSSLQRIIFLTNHQGDYWVDYKLFPFYGGGRLVGYVEEDRIDTRQPQNIAANRLQQRRGETGKACRHPVD